jgi:single-stranded-DNA-specific exonuclease
MDKAVSRILRAILKKEKIILYGDYDVDGTTATALLLLFLKKVGAMVDFYVPHRLKEGYGLNGEALKKIHALGAKLMITVDCGISSSEEICWAAKNGLDVIVTDHHEVPESLPPALAVLNPKQPDCSYPFKQLAGVGVAFNLVIALRSRLRREGFWAGTGVPNLKEYLDLVALGTVADVVPLLGVNRVLVKHGLGQLTRSARPGILALKEASGLGGMAVDTSGINFRFAPRINAAGRMAEAGEAVRLFLTEDGEEARKIAEHLGQLNAQRQKIEEDILAEAKRMIESPGTAPLKKSFVLASPNWHPGVIGIVASRLSEEYYRPTILIALRDNLGKGSGRSIDPFSLYEGLKACRESMETFGGHEQAAGLVIRAECIPGFAEAFEETVRACLKEEDFLPLLSIDAAARLDQMNQSFVSELESLSPYGMGNPEPILKLENLRVLDSSLVGKSHLRLRIQEGSTTRRAIGFHMGSRHPVVGDRMKMAFTPSLGFFQGRRTLDLKIIDLQPAD